RLWRQHSMSVSDTVRHGSRDVVFEAYPELGYNYRMTDMQAAVGREQPARLSEIVAQRRALAAGYPHRLDGVSGLGLPKDPAWAHSNWQSFCVRLPSGADQRTVMQALLDRGVSTRRGIMNAHLEPAYCDRASLRIASGMERSVAAQEHTIILPLYAQMDDADLDYVSETLKDVLSARG